MTSVLSRKSVHDYANTLFCGSISANVGGHRINKLHKGVARKYFQILGEMLCKRSSPSIFWAIFRHVSVL